MVLYLLVALAVFVIDQATKWLVKTNMVIGERIPVLGEFFMLTSHRNKGAAFGILQGKTPFFLTVTVIFVIGIAWYMYRTHKDGSRLLPFALSLMLGGAIGNFLDRAIYGEVVDFLQFTFRGSIFGWEYDYIFPIFNMADSAIVCGVLLVLFDNARAWRREVKQARAEANTPAEEPTHDSV